MTVGLIVIAAMVVASVVGLVRAPQSRRLMFEAMRHPGRSTRRSHELLWRSEPVFIP